MGLDAPTMGLKVFKIGSERQALALECDCPAHGYGVRTAWFDCGSHSGSLCLAKAVGWIEGRDGPGLWLCPQCADERVQKALINKSSKPRALIARGRQR